MRGGRKERDYPTNPELAKRIGEDPARYLCTGLDPIPRIRGIEDLGVANAWLQVAREVDASSRLISKIEERRDHLIERKQMAIDGGQPDGD